MDLNKLKVFKCVAEVGKINIASSELKIASSAISVAISNLESDLDVKLFTRHYKGMKLTKHGQSLYASAKKIFDEVDTVTKFLHSEKNEETFKLTIATSHGIASSNWLNMKLATILEDHTNLKIDIVEYKEGEIGNPDVDVFLCPYIYDKRELEQLKIRDVSFQLFASRSYVSRFGLPKTPDELDSHRLISFAPKLKNPFNDADSLLHVGRDQRNPREIFLFVNNSIALLKLIKMGLGIGSLHVSDILEHNLIPILPELEPVVISTYLVYRKANLKQKTIDIFSKYFIE